MTSPSLAKLPFKTSIPPLLWQRANPKTLANLKQGVEVSRLYTCWSVFNFNCGLIPVRTLWTHSGVCVSGEALQSLASDERKHTTSDSLLTQIHADTHLRTNTHPVDACKLLWPLCVRLCMVCGKRGINLLVNFHKIVLIKLEVCRKMWILLYVLKFYFNNETLTGLLGFVVKQLASRRIIRISILSGSRLWVCGRGKLWRISQS